MRAISRVSEMERAHSMGRRAPRKQVGILAACSRRACGRPSPLEPLRKRCRLAGRLLAQDRLQEAALRIALRIGGIGKRHREQAGKRFGNWADRRDSIRRCRRAAPPPPCTRPCIEDCRMPIDTEAQTFALMLLNNTTISSP